MPNRKRSRLNLGYSNGDIAKSYIGLLCLGKKDFSEIEAFRGDPEFRASLGLERIPSPAVLEHRLDEAALSAEWRQIILDESLHLIHQTDAFIRPVTIKGNSFIPVDIAKPFTFIGREKYCLNFEQEAGMLIRAAEQLASGQFLWRMEVTEENCKITAKLLARQIDFIIKQPLPDADTWVETARKHGLCCVEREGRKVYLGSVAETITAAGAQKVVYKVFKIIETTIDKNGQILLMPNYEAELYMTSLDISPAAVLELYNEHLKVCKSFKREFMSDLGFKQLPSGNKKTNELVLLFGVFAYNLLRFISYGNKRMKRIRDVIRELPKLSISEEYEE
ncbi:hypothetical protein [Heyndrickxia acidiproducens]|uniref:hypothetical protein n=1 Tax=Heyndrickxia acidiproducens TaxID=1121084 RepID=UPI00036FFAAB|nr:hypothetical protein [Heyndrickxia acidiproducens]